MVEGQLNSKVEEDFGQGEEGSMHVDKISIGVVTVNNRRRP